MIGEMVLEDVGVGENVVKAHVIDKYFIAPPRIKLRRNCLWVGRSCWVKRHWACDAPPNSSRDPKGGFQNKTTNNKKVGACSLICNTSG